MANHKDAEKRIRQNKRRRVYNRYYLSTMRTAIKRFRTAVEGNDVELATSLFPPTVKIIQKLGGKGIIHKNQANRRISRLHSALKKISA